MSAAANVVGVAEDVPAAIIIYVAVVVIVYPVARNFCVVEPAVIPKIQVVLVNAIV